LNSIHHRTSGGHGWIPVGRFTIRAVDLVDFDRADPDFVRIASRHMIHLP
jgi:hypothetical protein